jgi:hypothetical protein
MLHFNNLRYYTIPEMSPGWEPPLWLVVEVGLFAGRLYFDFEELEHIRIMFALGDHASGTPATLDGAMDDLSLEPEIVTASSSPEESADDVWRGDRSTIGEDRAGRVKTTKMLSFLHAWLSMRSRDQDFTHTPMGYICAHKALTKDHSFFREWQPLVPVVLQCLLTSPERRWSPPSHQEMRMAIIFLMERMSILTRI